MAIHDHFSNKGTVISLVYIDREPFLYWWYLSSNQLGTRTIYIASRIQNGDLLRRVRSELTTNDEIDIVFVNNPHGHGTLLVDFRRLNQSKEGKQLKVSIWPSTKETIRMIDKLLSEGKDGDS
jgi:hypothetical protein